MKHELSSKNLNAESIVDAIAETMRAGRPENLPSDSMLWGGPAVDFTVTALSLRSGMLGARDGRALYHHELRRRVPMPPEAEPEIEVWGGGTVPVWENGILTEPKYFSFFQDAPFAAFNPNHRRKWRAHEMLHGAVGFFWRPDMSRFEFYLGSRLNELLPVVHWYGLDEAFRPRCPKHQGQVLTREFCTACENAAIPYWETPDATIEERRATALGHVENALQHFRDEFEISQTELAETRAIESAIGGINASSDAVGYMRAHWNRCTSWSFGTWVERYLIDGHDYESTVANLGQRVERVFHELLMGPVEVSNFEARFGRRRVLDHTGRLLRALEMHEYAHEDHFADLLDSAEALTQVQEPSPEDVAAWEKELRERCTAIDWHDLLTTGLTPDEDAVAFALEGAQTLELDHELELSEEEFTTFVKSDEFAQHNRMIDRLSRWMKKTNHAQTAVLEFEAWLSAAPHSDDEFERFGAVPEELPATGQLRENSTLRRRRFEGGVLGSPGEELDVVAAYIGGEATVVILDDALAAALDNPDDSDATLRLLELGLLTFFPTAR